MTATAAELHTGMAVVTVGRAIVAAYHIVDTAPRGHRNRGKLSRSLVRGRRGSVLLKRSNDAHRFRADAVARQQLPIAGVPSGAERRRSCADEAANRRAGKPQGWLVERRCGVGLGVVHGSLALGRSTRRVPRRRSTHAHDDPRRSENSSPVACAEDETGALLRASRTPPSRARETRRPGRADPVRGRPRPGPGAAVGGPAHPFLAVPPISDAVTASVSATIASPANVSASRARSPAAASPAPQASRTTIGM
jgi:hypothetical protein